MNVAVNIELDLEKHSSTNVARVLDNLKAALPLKITLLRNEVPEGWLERQIQHITDDPFRANGRSPYKIKRNVQYILIEPAVAKALGVRYVFRETADPGWDILWRGYKIDCIVFKTEYLSIGELNLQKKLRRIRKGKIDIILGANIYETDEGWDVYPRIIVWGRYMDGHIQASLHKGGKPWFNHHTEGAKRVSRLLNADARSEDDDD